VRGRPNERTKPTRGAAGNHTPAPLIWGMNHLDLTLHHLGLRQHGLITAADAADLGMSRHGIKHRLATGQWQRVAPGIWRLTTHPITLLQRLHTAQLALGPQSWLSHHTAAALHGFEGFAQPAHMAHQPTTHPVHVTVPWHLRGRRSPHWALHALAVNQSLPRRGLEFGTHPPTGLRVTTPARTVLDLSTLGLSDDLLGDALDSAIRMKAASATFLQRLLDQRPSSRRRGHAQLRRLMDGAGGTNRLERAMLAWLRAEGLPRPDTQRALASGGRTVARLDFRFTDVRVLLEVSGALGHSSLGARRRHAAIVHAAQQEGELLVELMADEVFQRRPHAMAVVVDTRRLAFERGMFRPGFAPDATKPFR
jgi:hypothetical protein